MTLLVFWKLLIWRMPGLALRALSLRPLPQFVPRICSRKHPQPKWFNSDIQHQLNRVHTLRCITRSNPTPALLSKLSNAEAKLSEATTNAKQNFESQLIHSLAANNSSQILDISLLSPVITNYLLLCIWVTPRPPLILTRLSYLINIFIQYLLTVYMIPLHLTIYKYLI